MLLQQFCETKEYKKGDSSVKHNPDPVLVEWSTDNEMVHTVLNKLNVSKVKEKKSGGDAFNAIQPFGDDSVKFYLPKTKKMKKKKLKYQLQSLKR